MYIYHYTISYHINRGLISINIYFLRRVLRLGLAFNSSFAIIRGEIKINLSPNSPKEMGDPPWGESYLLGRAAWMPEPVS